MAKLPRVVYVRLVRDANTGKEYFLAGTDLSEMKLAVGETDKIGVYELTTALEAKGVVQTTETSNE